MKRLRDVNLEQAGGHRENFRGEIGRIAGSVNVLTFTLSPDDLGYERISKVSINSRVILGNLHGVHDNTLLCLTGFSHGFPGILSTRRMSSLLRCGCFVIRD